jgi:hypothetical protein
MKNNYKKFGAGQFVGFDFTFNLIRDRHDSGLSFKVGCIVGLSNTRRLVPFALVVSVDESKARCIQIFETFFSIMGGAQPSSIISDEAISFKHCLR